MKLALAASILGLALAACSSSPKPEPAMASSVTLTSADASEAQPKTSTAAERWAEKKIAAEVADAKSGPRDGADPLAMNSELEESSIPDTVITPASQLRNKSPGELSKAIGVVKSASTVEGAVKKLTQRLGKPSWVESPKSSPNAKRRVWVAPAGSRCHRLVLEPDGSVEVEMASKNEWRMLTASARQNPCTGEIKRGISND
jgi:hypothetical protein